MFFFNKILFIFRQREKEGEREGGKHQCVVASHMPPTEDPAYNPGMCPDWELNRLPFGLQANDQSTGPHQPGLYSIFFKNIKAILSWEPYKTRLLARFGLQPAVG